MSIIPSNGASLWLAVGGWVAMVAVLGWIVRSLRKSSPRALPDMVAQFRQTWDRDWQQFSLHADLPRLARKTYIHTRDGKTLEPPEDPICAVKQLILGVAEQFYDWRHMSPDLAGKVKTTLDETFDPPTATSTDVQTLVRKYLLDNHTWLDPSIINVLKTVTQDIVAPGVVKMKREISPYMAYKDVRGEWFIHINFQLPDSILVSHQKREQSFGQESNQEVQFQWNLDLVFSHEMTAMKASALYIPTLVFHPNASDETKSSIQLLLDEYTRS